MKKLFSMIVFASSVACIPGNSPVRVTDIFPITAKMGKCEVDETIAQYAGSLDAAGPGSYTLAFKLRNEIIAPSTIDTNGRELNTQLQNQFTATEIQLSYTSRDPVIVFETERIPVSLTLAGQAERFMLLDLIGPKAALKLRDNITDPLADPKMTLTARVEIKGRTESGQSMSATPVFFPLRVYTSDPMCTMGVPPAPLCVVPGQDGLPVSCCTAPGVPAGCI